MNIQQKFDKLNDILLNSPKPSEHLNTLEKENFFNVTPFDMIIKLKSIEQSPIYHKEGNVLNHTLLVIDEASKVKDRSEDKQVFMWAMLLHDIGKLKTTKVRRNKITSYNHDKVGYKLCKEFLSYSNFDKKFIEKVAKLVRWHMQALFIIKDLPFKEVEKMKEEVNINEIALISLCDKLGRKDVIRQEVIKDIELFIKKME